MKDLQNATTQQTLASSSVTLISGDELQQLVSGHAFDYAYFQGLI